MFTEPPRGGRRATRGDPDGWQQRQDLPAAAPPGATCRSVCLFLENSTVCRFVYDAMCLFVFGWFVVPMFVGADRPGSMPCGMVLSFFFGEFDPGSGRTLAACLTHASRTDPGRFGCRGDWRTGE